MSDFGTPPPPPPEEPGPAAGGYPGMQSMPSSAPPPVVPVSRPASIAMAVRLMYVGAALSLVSLLSTALMSDSIRASIEKSNRTSSTPLTASQIDAAVGVAVVFSIVVGLVAVGLWLWMASANGKGKKWARTLATVFFGLSVVSTLGGLINHPPVLSLVVGIITVVLGGYIIYLLYRPESSQFYAAGSAPKY
jgi:hypothetical protein